jgi:hypothetical protein
MTGQTSCEACTTCSAGFFMSAVCMASSDAACSACDPSCATCTGPGANQCSTCPSGEQLVGGACQSLCGTAPNPLCLVAGQAQLQSNDSHPGKETLKLRWTKIVTATMRGSFGDPVSGSTVAALCVFNDAGAPVSEQIVDRAGKTCGTKPCWRLTGKQGLAYRDKMASAAGVTKIGFVGGAPGKGKASAQGKNNAAKGLTSLPNPHLSAALTGNTSPTIELVTSDGLCVGAKMNRVVKDEALQYKAQKK